VVLALHEAKSQPATLLIRLMLRMHGARDLPTFCRQDCTHSASHRGRLAA